MCDLVPYSCKTPVAGQGARPHVRPTGRPLGLPAYDWPLLPEELADAGRRAEIAAEVGEASPDLLITLGDQPLRWFASHFGARGRLDAYGDRAQEYGRLREVRDRRPHDGPAALGPPAAGGARGLVLREDRRDARVLGHEVAPYLLWRDRARIVRASEGSTEFRWHAAEKGRSWRHRYAPTSASGRTTPGDLALLERLLGDPAMMQHLGRRRVPERLAAPRALPGVRRRIRRTVHRRGRPHASRSGGWATGGLDVEGRSVWECGWHVLARVSAPGFGHRRDAALARARSSATGAQIPVRVSIDGQLASNALCRRLGFTRSARRMSSIPRGA